MGVLNLTTLLYTIEFEQEVMASRVVASIVPGLRTVHRTLVRKFHNGPPRNPHGENPWPYDQQKIFFASGFGAFVIACFTAVKIDLFSPKFGEIDWDKIREERNAAVDEAAEPEDDDDDDDEDDEEDDE